ncbi:MAG: hypothetical protein AAB837_00355 [Patescibacteria group bacterium]
MESPELKNKENMVGSQEFIKERLGLIVDDGSAGFLKLDINTVSDYEAIDGKKNIKLDSPDTLFEYFEKAEIIEPDKICRPKGDTTFFTTAGIQHIETILRDDEGLKKKLFAVTQPVIRSQFMDKVCEGTSSSFVNFSVESIDSSIEDYISLFKNLINMILSHGVNTKDLRFSLKDDSVKWGQRRFKNSSIKIHLNNIEIGECVYIYDFPVSQENNISITDLGFGIERLRWVMNQTSPYFSEFESIYKTHDTNSANEIASILDPIRAMILIAGEGVKGSNSDHGYRLRQFSKRFVERNKFLKMDIRDLVHASLEYWGKWGYNPILSESEITNVIQVENERNFNVQFVSELEKIQGKRLRIEVNQPVSDFLSQVRFSVSEDIISNIIKTIT